ncbi:sodium/glutamate symporter [Eubacterium callanderi]|uniref:sodium/glutamate symporter n=1 Tax=Eubacterium callanderi TaxID=53442 RepID=UPI001C129554|nr:sodium/glutamate symporter [Eubacterium callanderi]MBU5303077.1 hypothetical protein [Eubacterium callanderi]
MEFSLNTLLIDFALASLLLVVAQFLRSKLQIFQVLLLPAPLIAGVIGLFSGRYFLNILPFSTEIINYPVFLIIVLFGGLFIGNKGASLVQAIKKTQDTFYLNLAAELGQYGFSILIGLLLIPFLFPAVNPAISLLLPSGFVGGHGYAVAVGSAIEELTGWEHAVAIGQTFATVGLIVSLLVGIILIKYGISKGYPTYIKGIKKLPISMRTGFYDSREQIGYGKKTTSAISIETFTWHLGLVLTATGGAYLLDYFLKSLGLPFSVPLVCLALFCGIAINAVLKISKLLPYTDKEIVTHIGSSITDYLLFFGVASLDIRIVSAYWKPILFLCVFGVAYCIVFVFSIGKRYFVSNWFERGIFIFGWNTGIAAMGIILLRILDPEFKTSVLEDYSLAYSVIAFVEIAIITFLPIFVSYGYGLVCSFVLILAFTLLILLARRNKKNHI